MKPRRLLIEDDSGRIDIFTRRLKDTEFVFANVRSGGQALDMLYKGSTEAIAGILLDHDLSESPFTGPEPFGQQCDPADQAEGPACRARADSQPQRQQAAVDAAITGGRWILCDASSVCGRVGGPFRLWLDDVRDNWEPEDA